MPKKIYICILILFILKRIFSFDFVWIVPENREIADFHVMTNPVTQQLFQEVMQFNNSVYRDEDHPVENVSWYEAIVFCNKLSQMHDLQPVYSMEENQYTNIWGIIPHHRMRYWTLIKADTNANGYRLPTQTEWDYMYSKITQDNDFDMEEYAWVYTNSEDKTHPVGSKKIDTLGLYDFLGNVREWLYEDRGILPEEYYTNDISGQTDFSNSMSYRPFRRNDYIVVPNRLGFYPVTKNSQIGFRVVRN